MSGKNIQPPKPPVPKPSRNEQRDSATPLKPAVPPKPTSSNQ
jgi:hypothetical protein